MVNDFFTIGEPAVRRIGCPLMASLANRGTNNEGALSTCWRRSRAMVPRACLTAGGKRDYLDRQHTTRRTKKPSRNKCK